MSAPGSASNAGDGAATIERAGEGAGGRGRISCVAVIGATNAPLYMRTFEATKLPRLHRRDERGGLQMQELVYNSLDVVEERMGSMKSRQMRENDGFLGCLAVVGSTYLYGCVTNTDMKLIMAIKHGAEMDAHASAHTAGYSRADGADADIADIADADAGIREAFRRLRFALVRAFMNGLEPIARTVRGARFDADVEAVVRWFT